MENEDHHDDNTGVTYINDDDCIKILLMLINI